VHSPVHTHLRPETRWTGPLWPQGLAPHLQLFTSAGGGGPESHQVSLAGGQGFRG